MSKYFHKDPVDNGFIKFKLSRSQHKKLFPKRKRNWSTYNDYYISKDEFIMSCNPTVLLKIAAILSFPIVVLFYGLSDFKDIFKAYYGLFHGKPTGSFGTVSFRACTDKYNEIVQISKVKFKC